MIKRLVCFLQCDLMCSLKQLSLYGSVFQFLNTRTTFLSQARFSLVLFVFFISSSSSSSSSGILVVRRNRLSLPPKHDPLHARTALRSYAPKRVYRGNRTLVDSFDICLTQCRKICTRNARTLQGFTGTFFKTDSRRALICS